jgi:uncharacterized protein (TIGR02271 family)
MAMRMITAFFDTRAEAEQAQRRMRELGVTADRIRVVDSGADSSARADDKGLWEKIKDFFSGDEDRYIYEEGLRRGGYLLTAEVDESEADQACALLEQSSAVDLKTREAEWRAQGWRGAQSNPAAKEGQMRTGERSGTEETIPIVEERLRVGKREVHRGGMRVRSYVVEEPVHEQVRLRTERTEVERHPVNKPVRGASGDLLRERVIDVHETTEEPVVEKEAVIKEEVGVRKHTEERVENIDDTVRRTEVDVDRDRGIDPALAADKRRTRKEPPEKRH